MSGYLVVVFCSLLLWLYCLPTVQAVKGHYTFTEKTTYGRYLEKSFGLAERGIIEMNYYMTVEDTSLPYDSYLMLLVLTEKEKSSWFAVLEESDSSIRSKMSTLCTNPSWRRILVTTENTKENKGHFNLTIGTESGIGLSGTSSDQFTLVALQCRDSFADNAVTLHVHYEMKNARPSDDSTTTTSISSSTVDTSYYSHLAIEEVMLVRFYGGSIIIYTMFTIGIAAMIYTNRLDLL